MSKLDAHSLGFDVSLIEAAKKVNCKENDALNPSGAGPARLPSEPSASGQKMNIADDKKHGKNCKCNECCAMDAMKPGYNKSIT